VDKNAIMPHPDLHEWSCNMEMYGAFLNRIPLFFRVFQLKPLGPLHSSLWECSPIFSMGMVFGMIREEMPKFKNHGNLAGMQCREYEPYWVAKTSSDAYPEARTENEFQSTAFRTLAKYIGVFSAPQNQSQEHGNQETIAMTAPVVMTPSEKIAMTAPVVMTSEKMDMTAPVVTASKTMSFILPSKYIQASKEPPKPLDARIKLEKIPGHIALVHTFSGFSSAEKARPIMTECVARAREASPSLSFVMDEMTKEPKWEFLGYNPPFTLPWCRTNEVAIHLAELPDASVLKSA